ncbi:ferrochelatase [Terrilactibacillus sp. S3-3]|nr:ferrochelatase [Terrilactibacillus sp. S3-3]
MEKKRMGLLLMAYGTPYKAEDIEPYYTNIRHGRRPSDAQLADLTRRYQAIGGSSPLAKITREQAGALDRVLNERQDEIEFNVYLGLKYIHPFIEDAVKAMHDDGIEEAISLVLAPHYSKFSVKSYNDRAISKADELGYPKISAIESWYREPQFIQFWSDQLQKVYSNIPENEHDETLVVFFSAHSLPEKILKNGDPYPEQVRETMEAIAERARVRHYVQAWQSAGKTPDPWLGPDVLDVTRELYRKEHYKHFVFCPIGFIAEHLEVLYDNDKECKAVVEELGAHYHRPDMPNSDPAFIDCLASAVLKKCNEGRKILHG